jgi:hypothetical protein
VVAAVAEVAAGAAAVEVAAVAGLLAAGVAAAGWLAAEVAAAAGSVASGSAAARLALRAWLARVARAAAYLGERAACAESHAERRCDGRRITSGLPQQSDKLFRRPL